VVKTYLCSPLCRFTSPTPTPIVHSASAPLSLISFPVLPATCLQQDVCRRLILGYNRWYFISAHPTPSLLQCHVHFANSLNVRRRQGLRNYFSEFGKVDACTIVRDADGKSRGFAFLTFEEPASVNAVMIREHFLDGEAVRVPHHLSLLAS
ncbi:hypothetical protein EDB83DRAFT_2494009, partial [Lactarius deliciosus]